MPNTKPKALTTNTTINS